MSFTKKILLVLTIVVCVIWGLGFGYLIGISVSENDLGSGIWGETNSCLTEDEINAISGGDNECLSEKSEYYSERFVVAGYSADGAPIVGEISLTRLEQSEGIFLHSYTGYIIYKDRIYDVTDQHKSSDRKISESRDQFSYKHIPAPDLSTREDFEIEWVLDGMDVRLGLTGFEGDFIVENSPEYTKYVSVGKATIELDSETIIADAMVTSIYSIDSSKYIFFDNYDNLELEAYQLVWWDEEHNFYLVDKSDVKSQHEGYKSHSWFLYKTSDGSTRRDFDLENLSMLNQRAARSWVLELPLFAHVAQLSAGKTISGQGDKGLVIGEISKGSGVDIKSKSVGTYTFYDF